MPFRINDLMITVLPKVGQVFECDDCSETCDGGVSSCPGGCSSDATFPSDMCPPRFLSEPAELVELRELLRHTLSRVEEPGVVRKILPETPEELNALEAQLQGALYELRTYKATKSKG